VTFHQGPLQRFWYSRPVSSRKVFGLFLTWSYPCDALLLLPVSFFCPILLKEVSAVAVRFRVSGCRRPPPTPHSAWSSRLARFLFDSLRTLWAVWP